MFKRRIGILLLIICFMLLDYRCIVYASGKNVEQTTENQDVINISQDEIYTNENQKDAVSELITNLITSFGIEVIGAFLGFLSAIAFANRSNKSQRKELDAGLYRELEAIYNELTERIEDTDFWDFYRYQIPIWEINLASGSLALVANAKIYNKYIEVYSKIQYAQVLENEYLHTKLFADTSNSEDFACRYIDTINSARKREAEAIRENIEKNILSTNKDKRKELKTCLEKKCRKKK